MSVANEIDDLVSRAVRRLTVFRLILVFIVCFALLIGVLQLCAWWDSPIRRLGSSGSNVHEWHSKTINFTGDFAYGLRADCSEEAFHKLAREMGFTYRLGDKDADHYYPGGPDEKLNWWDPPSDFRGAYFRISGKGHRQTEMLLYRSGHLYHWHDQT